jgi:hypothetical protein
MGKALKTHIDFSDSPLLLFWWEVVEELLVLAAHIPDHFLLMINRRLFDSCILDIERSAGVVLSSHTGRLEDKF